MQNNTTLLFPWLNSFDSNKPNKTYNIPYIGTSFYKDRLNDVRMPIFFQALDRKTT